MKAILQRVNNATVTVGEIETGKIDKGLLIFLCIEKGDTQKDLQYIINKIINIRIFSDKNDKMNLSVTDVKGEIMCISQFTLCADCNIGNRPSFTQAEDFNKARSMYEIFIDEIKKRNIKIESGVFGADMKVKLENDGPVTIILDTKSKY